MYLGIVYKNAFRYRGYYYDVETGLYYVSSRYYDPEVCRFINADGYASTGQGFAGNNMFAYCNNNPVNYADPSGHFGILAVLGIVAVSTICLLLPADNPKTLTVQQNVKNEYLDNTYNSDTVNVYTPSEQPEEGKINVLVDVNNISNGKSDPNIHVENSHNIRKKR